MSEMVERVAKAVKRAEDLRECYVNEYEGMAREIIAAMREPTKGMLAVGPFYGDSDRKWRAMIDEALK